MIDEPIRKLCAELDVIYSTWIDDIAFSGTRARELIQPTVSLLAANGLRVNRKKIRIMGPSAIKSLTGTRLGSTEARVPKDKLSRLRSAIHKFRKGLVAPKEAEHCIVRLMGQLRFMCQVCPRDASNYARQLALVCEDRWLDAPSKRFLQSLS